MKRNLLKFVLLSVMSLVTLSASAQQGGEPDYLCFTANEAEATVALNMAGTPTEVTIQCSTDGTTWNTYEFNKYVKLANLGSKVYFRNASDEVTGFSIDKISFYYFAITGSIAASGNVMSLVDKSCEATTIPCENCFCRLFEECTTLTTAPKLPATTLKSGCYQKMFYDCTALATAPELPAETLTDHCYYEMFFGCTSLETAPELPAKTLADYCYDTMFSGCAKLTTAPQLPATTLAKYCYKNMFYNCVSLATAPQLPAETLADYCYSSMFYGCALETAPQLPAETLANNCYENMFYGCKNLKTAPKLPVEALANNCYKNMFNRCTALEAAPELPAKTLAESCYYGMFNGCTKLTAAPKLPATTLAESCYSYMFNDCATLETAPELPVTTLAESCYSNMFYGCTKLTAAPKLPAKTLANNCYDYMFNGCTALTTAPQLPAETLADHCYDHMFYGCTSLTTAPELPVTTLAEFCYNNMFYGCTSLTTAPELPATTMKKNCYYNMFNGCTSLATAPELPATELAESCYQGMFSGCTSLATAPELPATTLITTCYKEMFKGSAVTDIKVAFTVWGNTASWVSEVISTSHTITCPEALKAFKTADGIKQRQGTSNIPSGWTIKTTYDLEVTSAGWASMCVNLPLTVPEGAEVYYASAVDGNTITLTQIEAGTVMAAKTAVIVKKPTEGTTVSFPVGIAENGTITSFTDNLFQGSSVAKAMVKDVPVYVLSGANATNGNPQFQNYTGTTLDAHKIWLPKSALGGATGSIQFRFDDATAINNVPMESSDNAIYNLAGQRVSSDYRGLVIKNGKKTWNN